MVTISRRLALLLVAAAVVTASCANRSERVTQLPVVPTSLIPNGPGDVGTGRCTFAIGEGLGALVSDILPASPAEGTLAVNDVVHTFEGQQIRTSADLVTAVRERAVGDTVTLEGTRDGRPISVSVTLGESAEVAGRAILGVMVGTLEERREPDELESQAVSDPLARVAIIGGDLWVVDPTGIAWQPLGVSAPEGALIVAGGDVYTVEVSGPGAATIVSVIDGEAQLVDLAEWTAVSIIGTLENMALIGAEQRAEDGTVIDYAILGVDPVAGVARWSWITNPESENPVPLGSYRSTDGSQALVALGPPGLGAQTGLWVLLRDVGGEPEAEVARGLPAETQMIGWHDADHLIAVLGGIIAEASIVDPATGDTAPASLPVDGSSARMWAVGDGRHILMDEGEGLVLATVGGLDRRRITAACGPTFVTDLGWFLGR